MYGKRCMINASAAAECGAAIDVPENAWYRGCGTPLTSSTVVLLIAVLGAVAQDHFATPHWLNRCCPGTRMEPSGLTVRPMLLLIPEVVNQRPSRSGRKYGAAPRGDGLRTPALPELNPMIVPVRATSMAPFSQCTVLPLASATPSGVDRVRHAAFRP